MVVAMVLPREHTLLQICILLLVSISTVLDAARSHGNRNLEGGARQSTFRYDRNYRDYRRRARSEKPNIILILTDDQDIMLGSMSTMTKTLKFLKGEGVHFNNSFVSTPMCCPSRSSLLTGMYPHNHHVYTNNDNCSGIEWQKSHEPRTFAKYLSDAGYRTGFFGKYLNEYNGTYIPPGWREWVGLVRNSRFYNYTLNFNGQKVKHDDNYFRDYFTDLIANDSVTFLKRSKEHFQEKPVMMVLSVPAPHGPEDSAPQYQHMFYNNTLHRTTSWNYMNNTDKQWLLQQMKPLEPIGAKFTDTLQQKRLQTLQSVDSMVEKVYYELKLLGELDNSYIIYTSDHGYHLGQFGIVKGKALPYDFDIRVPLYIRGPGIFKDTVIPNVVGNIDLAPTILDMAGIPIPAHMDGTSLMKLIKRAKLDFNIAGDFVETRKLWRDTILIERGKVTKKLQKEVEREKDQKIINEHQDELLPFANPKLRRMLKICKDPDNGPPCTYMQKWVCFRDDRHRQRVKKCRNYNKTVSISNNLGYYGDDPVVKTTVLPVAVATTMCDCSRDSMSRQEEYSQRDFLHTYVNQKDFDPVFVRGRRSIYEKEEMKYKRRLIAQQLALAKQRCRFFPNDTFGCDQQLLEDPQKWVEHKMQLDEMIEETRKRLRNLKKIRKHMKKQRKNLKQYSGIDTNDSGPSSSPVPVNNTSRAPCICDPDLETADFSSDYKDTEFSDDESREDYGSYGTNDHTPDTYAAVLAAKSRKGKKKNCNHSDMKCTTHTNDHWKTPPYWTDGPFCFCTNANTNTYWCIRTVNVTHNFLYCEFIDSFISYYDFVTDPHQLHNIATELNYGVMSQLHDRLMEMRQCVGAKMCSHRAGARSRDRSHRRRRRRISRDQHTQAKRHRRRLVSTQRDHIRNST